MTSDAFGEDFEIDDDFARHEHAAETFSYLDSIPFWVTGWYGDTATQQISVRVPRDLVSFADAEVEAGNAQSRADVVVRALESERRHRTALRDARLYAWDPGDEVA